MNIKLNNVVDNKLFGRKDVSFEIHHQGATTPSRQQVKELLASELGSTASKVIVAHMATSTGLATTKGDARCYVTADEATKHERKFLLKRNEGGK